MKINADLSQRAVVYSADIPWVNSPSPGVQRRMLERNGREVARATSLVRYAPATRFDAHTHDIGEEFLVLEGVFSDDTGDFPAGMYVRNPPGSRHQPHSEEGATIFVKLRQFDLEDRRFVRIDTRTAEWRPGLVPGLRVMPLHSHAAEQVALVRWAPGTHFNRHAHPEGEEIFVLDGVFEDEHGRYPEGAWLRNPPDSIHTPFSNDGCTIYVKTGHLTLPP